MNNKWLDIKLLSYDYKKIVDYYFNGKTGKFIIDKNILILDIDSWGIEKMYINNNKNELSLYKVLYDNFNKIYNIAISIQIANWETFRKMESYLNNFKSININIYFIMINDIEIEKNINYLKEKYRHCVIISAENKGMDVGLFLINIMYIRHKKYVHDYLYKIHTKTNDEFRNNTLVNLLGSHDKIINNIRLLSKDNIGMISGNTIFKFKDYKDAFQSNFYHLESLVNYLYGEKINNNYLEFSAGTMFIIKMKNLNIFNIKNLEHIYNMLNSINTLDYYWYSVFYKLNINNKQFIYNDYINDKNNKFPNNINYNLKTGKSGLRDSMIEHAMERLFGYICKRNNNNII